MKIIKYRKLNNYNKYELILEDGSKVQTYEDVILKLDLLLKMEVTKKEDISIENLFYDTYYTAVKYLKTRLHSIKEVKDYLLKKEYSDIDSVINKLVNQGYLNDRIFSKGYLNDKLITTNYGPSKIAIELLNKGVDQTIVDEVIKEYDLGTQEDKIKKIINRIIKSNHNKSNFLLKQKILNELKRNGFDSSLINEQLDIIKFDDDSFIAKKEYDKLYKKYSKKYSDKELDYVIRQKLYQKGFKYENQ